MRQLFLELFNQSWEYLGSAIIGAVSQYFAGREYKRRREKRKNKKEKK